MPRLLELFSGTKSIGRQFEKAGFEVFSVDIEPALEPMLVANVFSLPINAFAYGGFDVVWASPPCTTFSVASIGKHWTREHRPKTAEAGDGFILLLRTLAIIRRARPKLLFIENPVGKMRRMKELSQLRRCTVTYCSYGDSRMKPTDIWTNAAGWTPRPPCKAGNDCHDAAPRGSRTGTQGMKNARERGRIPEQLGAELAAFCLNYLTAAAGQKAA